MVMAPHAGAQTGQGTSPAPAFEPPPFADNVFAYVYGPAYRNPFITSAAQPRGADIVRNGIEFKHVDAWQYGHNLVELVAKKSGSVEPAAGGGSGAQAFYAILRSGISINRVAHRTVIALGPLRDIDIQAGLNFQEKHTDMSPNERTLYLGPNFQCAFGRGMLNVALQLRKEWNYNGILGRNENFNTGFNIEPVWHFPLDVGRVQFMFEGYAEYNSPMEPAVERRCTLRRREHFRWRVAKQDLPVHDLDLHGLQALPDTGSKDARAAVRLEQGTVRITQQQRTIRCEEILRLPVEQVPRVRTAIQVGAHCSPVAHDEAGHRPFAVANGEFERAGVGQVAERADTLILRQYGMHGI
jgi:hypothetical protein